MNEPLISIIVPAYNIEAYLPRCLDSLLAQEYRNLEIIVVNDGSRDHTGAVIDAYAAKDSRIIAAHKENGGVTSARLHGLSKATGEWIGFVDGDDSVAPDMFSRLMTNALTYSAEISHCGYRMVFPDHVDYYYNSGKITVQKGRQGLYDLLEGKFVEPGLVSKLYRRELFDGLAEWMDTSIRINEDLLMNYYLFRRTSCSVHEDICPYHYILRRGSAAVSNLNEYKLKNPLQVLDCMLTEEDDPSARQILENRLVYQLICSATMSLDSQKELIRPWRKECRKRLRKRIPLKEQYFPKKLRIMAFWAAIWPWSYGFVHRVYARISGSAKKYEVK